MFFNIFLFYLKGYYETLIQWNFPKADTIGAKKIARFIEMSVLQRFNQNSVLDGILAKESFSYFSLREL